MRWWSGAAQGLGLALCATVACSGVGPVGPGGENKDCSQAEGHAVPSEGWAHVMEGTPLTYTANPPASGPHYPRWGRYMVHTTPLARPYWLHNVEHGAVVLLHRSDAPQAAVDALHQAYDDIPLDVVCGHKRALLTVDDQLDVPVAVVAADRVIKDTQVDSARVKAFVAACRGKAPENVCGNGDVGQ